MLEPGPSFQRLPQHSSLESLKQRFKHRLDAIFGQQLTVDTIETFADGALSQTTRLAEDILKEYRENPNVKAQPTTLSTAKEEDEAFTILGLEKISKILERISKIKDEIDSIHAYLETEVEKVDTVITPPQENHTVIQEGSGGFEQRIFPRLLTLLYILEHDLAIPHKEIKITEGSVRSNMVRKTPYLRVEIPTKNRVVYICDEEGNVSYVFDTKKIKACGLTLEEIDLDNKTQKNSFLAEYPGIGIRIIQTVNWRDNITLALEEPILEEVETSLEQMERVTTLVEKRVPKQNSQTREIAKGELNPWKGFWADEIGRHWGTMGSISKKLEKSYIIFKNRINDPRIENLDISGRGGRIERGYCFEQFLEIFPEFAESKKRAETSGEWKGFWIDPDTKQHWGTAGAVKEKFDVIDWVTIKRYIKRGNLNSIRIEDSVGRNADAYCYEDFLEIEEFVEFLTSPQVNGEGEWQDFWIDPDTKQHWTSLGKLAAHFKTTHKTITTYAEKINLPRKKIKTTGGEVVEATTIESFQANTEFMEFINLPKAKRDGEWAGFYVDKNGSHFGTVLAISKKLSMRREKIDELVRKYPNELKKISMRDAGGKRFTGYNFDEVSAKLLQIGRNV